VQLNDIQAVVRPRTPWESIDLGFSMVQQWWKPLYKLWFAFMLPYFLLIFCIFGLFYQNFLIAILILWWLKPVYDRILLHFFSRALFGEQPTIRQTVKILPRLLFKTHLFWALTLWRLELARSFNLAIWQLEGLRGKKASQRRRLLQTNTLSPAVWLLIVCMHFELVLQFSLFVFVYLMLPITENSTFFYTVFFEEALWVDILSVIVTFLIISLIEPLYVAAGFALYLNRRTHLEGWDIELIFRRIAARKLF
jgi:hypothetical protein